MFSLLYMMYIVHYMASCVHKCFNNSTFYFIEFLPHEIVFKFVTLYISCNCII